MKEMVTRLLVLTISSIWLPLAPRKVQRYGVNRGRTIRNATASESHVGGFARRRPHFCRSRAVARCRRPVAIRHPGSLVVAKSPPYGVVETVRGACRVGVVVSLDEGKRKGAASIAPLVRC